MSEQKKIRLLSMKDLEVSYFCGSGAGGQARNKVASGVQIKHPESGAIGRASDTRSQDQNKRAAFKRLMKDPRMKFWVAKKVYEIKAHESIEESVERDCKPENCVFEVKREGKWVQVPASHFETAEAKQEG
jgi:protein subunit release factor B